MFKHPTADATIFHLDAPISDVTPLPVLGGTMADLFGRTVTCYGYGAKAAANYCTSNDECATGQWCQGRCLTPSDELRSANLIATLLAEGSDAFLARSNAQDQSILPGDSGGPCVLDGAIAGVTSWWSFDLSVTGHVGTPAVHEWIGTALACGNDTTDSGETDVDCGGAICGGCATGKACTTGLDCEGGICTAGICTSHCSNQAIDFGETDVDCGGNFCAKCNVGQACSATSDCASAYCLSGVCADHCSDNVKDANETDVDCGGGFCGLCADGQRCIRRGDCASGHCGGQLQSYTLVAACLPATCVDGIKNQWESDIDCGDPANLCPRCDLGKLCATNDQCTSRACSNGSCQASCSDGLRDQLETDIDCGGTDVTCSRCADHQHCARPTDCASRHCGGELVNGQLVAACLPATCVDRVQNGGETGLNCGGATECARCGSGIGCQVGGDCVSGSCVASVCQ